MPEFIIRYLRWGYWLGILFCCHLMVLITLQYVPLDFEVAFLATKQTEIQWLHYKIAFFTHVYTSIFVLLAGLFQFSTTIRRKYPKLHRVMGYVYGFSLLVLAAPSGLVMGFYGNGGILSKIAFCFLAIFWWFFTAKALWYAKQKNWVQHQNYMYRSYALTLSAITLRLLKPILVSTTTLEPMQIYTTIAWAGWVLNWIIAEIIILNLNKNNC